MSGMPCSENIGTVNFLGLADACGKAADVKSHEALQMTSSIRPARAVTIEPQVIRHTDGLYAALLDPRIYTFLGTAPPASVEAVRERIEKLSRGAPAELEEVWLNWTVFEDEVVVGYTQATIHADGIASLAYVLNPSVWGRSVAYEACVLTLTELDAMPSVVEIVADTELGNTRSQALLVRLGFGRMDEAGQDLFYRRVKTLPADITHFQR